MAKPTLTVHVTAVTHYTDGLFRFSVTRPANFRFEPGQFVMLGLRINGEAIMRAYSMASPAWHDELDFYSVKIQDGPLTSRLQHIQVGDEILLAEKAVGNLTIYSLKPGRRLFMLSTGTGIAPFCSICRDPETYNRFEEVILTHTCRQIPELEYGKEVINAVRTDPLCAEFAGQLRHYMSVTREDFQYRGRITELIDKGVLFDDLSISPFNPEHDRVMLCGSIEFNADTKSRLEAFGFTEGSARESGTFVQERAFVG